MSVERALSPKQPTRLKNKRCAYCNAEFVEPGEPEKEHVVGKNFVPRGVHEQQWNLHLNSCHSCNQRKSALENDISAITLHPGLFAATDGGLAESEASRKAKAISRRTGKPVSDSIEQLDFSGSFGSAYLEINLSSPPQLDEQRAFELALFQLQGFFFFLTYQQEEDMGYMWPGHYMPLGLLRKSDWGNPLSVSFSRYVKDWDLRLAGGEIAQGFFCVVIKKHPVEALWSWAIEWNRSTRLFGLLGDAEKGEDVMAALEVAQFSPWIQKADGSKLRYRTETPLADDEEDLFFFCK